MKKYYIIIIAFLGCLGLQAKDMTGLKIYINPGHGGGVEEAVWCTGTTAK